MAKPETAVAESRDVAPYIAAMARVATGVTVVATAGVTERTAQTVSAMCSVSADPSILLVCINKRSPITRAIETNGVFCVSALARQHDHVADTFAGRPWPGKERWDFTCGDWEQAPSGSPRLTDALAAFDCEVHEVTNAGTHLVYFGLVTDVLQTTGAPLVYTNRSYYKPQPVEPSRFPEYPDAYPPYLDNKPTKGNS